jgi:virulence factor Mce-like protein
VASRIPLLVGAVFVLVVGVLVIGVVRYSGGHTLRASFDSVEQLAPGLEVRVAGRKVGKVGSVDLVDGRPVAKLKIQEGDIWPLRSGTTATIRWGSTTSLAYRYVELNPGPASAPNLADGGRLATTHTITPFELDQSYRIFRGRTRGDLRATVGELAATLGPNGGAIKRGLHNAPSGLDSTAALLRELAADQHALRTLMVAGDQATGALADRQGELGGLVDHAAATFDEFAKHAQAQQRALDRAPQTLNTATSTLGRLDRSLVGLQALVNDLAPGAGELRTLARPAHQALSALYRVAPLATQTLRRGSAAAPGLTRLLQTGTPFLPRLGNVLGQLQPMVACLRPYAPELAGQLSTWTGYNKNFDQGGHYARTFPLQANAALLPGTSLNSAQITTLLSGRLNYAMPRPPGLNAGQPWFQPQCGAGPDSIDASKDPEGAGR